MENSNSHILNLLKVGESLLALIVAFGFIIGAILFAFFGISDITNSSNIGLETNHYFVGSVGLLLMAANIYGFIILKKRENAKQIAVAVGVLILSIVFAYVSPMRLGALFGSGDPAQFAAYWSGATATVLLLLVAAQKATGRSV